MGRRISASRVHAVAAQGKTLTSSAGPAMSSSIQNTVSVAEGSLFTTELKIDLGNAAAPAFSFSGSAGGNIIGVSSSAEPHQNAQLLRVAEATMGIITGGDLICTEAPVGGNAKIGLYMGPAVSASHDLTTAGSELIAYATQVKGLDAPFTKDNNSVANQYVYLASSGSATAAYTSGKFILRLYGYLPNPDLQGVI